uniref:Uncharacterized protein n=1 Tax=Octactis speculum TaxID=3111310 RepID=A0A7S2F7V4_9STRA|mmetsp:Transcript_15339/g.20589  ORF Transcript_15339/g.20589 Transcript_15339/m.20589 type:complete len:219 (+) Transcript_15339:287-943(+)
MVFQPTREYCNDAKAPFNIGPFAGSMVYRACNGHNNMKEGHSCNDNVPKKITTSAESLLHHVMAVIPQNERLFERAAAIKMPYHIVIYERLQVDEESELNALRTFLGLKNVDVLTSTNLVKVTPENLRDTLTNYDEFESLLVNRSTRDGASGSEKRAFACLSRMIAAKTPVEHYPFCLPTSKNIPKSLRPEIENYQDEHTSLVQLRSGVLGKLQTHDH